MSNQTPKSVTEVEMNKADTQLHDEMEREAMRLTINELEEDRDSYRDEITGLRARCAELEAALRPFLLTQAGRPVSPGFVYELYAKGHEITRARRALEREKGSKYGRPNQ